MNTNDVIHGLYSGIKSRLLSCDKSLGKVLLPVPSCREVSWPSGDVTWPLITKQGVEWYADAPMENFDFLAEKALGLHENARVIYDFGGHHGIWALYYSHVVGSQGRVYTFEPSIVNVEASALLFFLNSAHNVVNVAAGVGSGVTQTRSVSNMIVDFVSSDSLEIVDIRDIAWDRADFLKMDVEGYEYEILTHSPWIFDLATHMHIELHIPHLQARKLDYRNVTNLIPFEKFEVFNYSAQRPVTRDTPLEGFCSLMMRRKDG